MTMFNSLVNEVQDAATSGSTKRQLKALTQITDLFLAGSAGYSTRQIELFDEIFKVLVEVIELKTRIELAQRFAADPNTPAALARAFAASDSAAVAAPVLSQSMVLVESDLIASASTQGQDHLYAIAQRRSISEAITDILIARGEQRVVHAVASNEGARISDDGFGKLVQLSGTDVKLALHVGARHDIPRHHFVRLLETASAAVCSKIIAANPIFADVVQGAVTGVTDAINGEVRKACDEHVKARFQDQAAHRLEGAEGDRRSRRRQGAGFRKDGYRAVHSRGLSDRNGGTGGPQCESRSGAGDCESRRLLLGNGQEPAVDGSRRSQDVEAGSRPGARQFRGA